MYLIMEDTTVLQIHEKYFAHKQKNDFVSWSLLQINVSMKWSCTHNSCVYTPGIHRKPEYMQTYSTHNLTIIIYLVLKKAFFFQIIYTIQNILDYKFAQVYIIEICLMICYT